MHLALVISSLNAGGAERAITELANYWTTKGHQVSLITFAAPQTIPFYPLHPEINLIQLDRSGAANSLYARAKNIFQRLRTLRSTLKNLRPNRIISFVDITNITTILATTGMKIPVIVSERTDPNYHVLSLAARGLRFFLYRFATKIIIQTKNAANYFNNRHDINIIPNAILPPKNVKTSCSKEVCSIVSVGRLTASKDFMFLVTAFKDLLNQYPQLVLTIYGEGPEREALEALIDSYGLEKHVFLPGTVKNIYEKLAQADLFIFPSRYEGFPNALCEAMAIGLPVIASTCSGNIDVVRDTIDGRLFPVGDVACLTDITCEVIEDYAQRQRLSQAARTITTRFSPKKVYEMWDKIIVRKIKE